jgi:protein O-GlcNAc transferase
LLSATRGGFSVTPQTVPAADAARKLREAIALHQQGRIAEAERSYADMLTQFPNHPDALQYLGVIQSQKGDHAKALELLNRSLASNPRSAAAHYNRANILRDVNRLEDALRGYDDALALHPTHVSALINRAAVLRRLERHADALTSYDRAIAIVPNEVNAHHGRGIALGELSRHTDAIAALDRALALAPGKAELLISRGHALRSAGRYSDAARDFLRAVESDRKSANAYAGLASALMELRHFTHAVESYDRAMTLDPNWIELNYGRSSALIELRRYEEAIAGFCKLLAVRPDYPYAAGMLMHARNISCDWSDPGAAGDLIARVRAGKRAASPFAMLEISDSPPDMQQCARIVIRDRFEPGHSPLWNGEMYHHKHINLAYVSADLRAHPVGNLIAPVIEMHDRSQFEVTGIAYTDDDGSDTRQRLRRSFDRFVEAGDKSDFDIARTMRELEIDIAVDLSGLTANCRPRILCFRPAPVQVNYLGYAGTMGSHRYDYIIGDETVIPEQNACFYDEKIAFLPRPFMPFDAAPASPSAVIKSRSDARLPESAFVFASFNNTIKFNPPVFDIWIRLLRKVQDSVLWLAAANPTAMRNLASEAEKRGVAAERLVFAPRLPDLNDHLARLALADLFLDTLPYNAHSTAADALKSGLPVLTCRGHNFAGRVAASLLESAGLNELVATSPDEYESRAMLLAQNPGELAGIRAKLRAWRAERGAGSLHLTVRNLETAYRQMWMRAQQALPPESFTIEAVK